MAGSSCAYEESIIHKSGRRVDIRITKLPIIVDGKTVGIYGIAQDLTSRRALESRLQQAEKLEAVGRLAAGIAHDFNNVLTVVHSYASMIGHGLPAGSTLRSDVDEIQSAVKRAREMTQPAARVRPKAGARTAARRRECTRIDVCPDYPSAHPRRHRDSH